MLPQNRYRWFYRIVRHNTQRIDEETAAKYKFRLAAVYVVSAFGIFCMATTMRDKDKAEKRKKYGNDEFEGNYWLRLYDAKKATRVKLSGLTYEGTEEFDLQKIRQEEIAKGEKLIVEDGDLKL
ncbi:uncharacterized protein [Bemisia tabaci]